MPSLSSTVAPNDFLGTIAALAGVEELAIIIDGTAGCCFFQLVGGGPAVKRLAGRFYTTMLDEHDITFGGGEDKLVRVIGELDRQGHRAIAIVANPVSALIGADAAGVIRELKGQTRARLLNFSGGGWQGNAALGAGQAILALCRELGPESGSQKSDTVNLIGPTAHTFNWTADERELRRLLGLLGLEVGTVISARTSVTELGAAGRACLNLVTAPEGLAAADHLAQRCGTPYHFGLPYGIGGTRDWLEAVAQASGRRLDPASVQAELDSLPNLHSAGILGHGQHGRHLRAVVAAPYPIALGLTRLLCRDWGLDTACVRLPADPGDEGRRQLEQAGAAGIHIGPADESWRRQLELVRPQLLLGSSLDLALAPQVPLRLRVAAPVIDAVDFFDGAPQVGWRGYAHLTQTIVNAFLAGASPPAARGGKPAALAGFSQGGSHAD